MLKYKKREELKLFLEAISKIENLAILNTTKTDDIKIIEAMKKYSLDFDDALNYYLAKKYNLKGIISYDKHFDKKIRTKRNIATKKPSSLKQKKVHLVIKQQTITKYIF